MLATCALHVASSHPQRPCFAPIPRVYAAIYNRIRRSDAMTPIVTLFAGVESVAPWCLFSCPDPAPRSAVRVRTPRHTQCWWRCRMRQFGVLYVVQRLSMGRTKHGTWHPRSIKTTFSFPSIIRLDRIVNSRGHRIHRNMTSSRLLPAEAGVTVASLHNHLPPRISPRQDSPAWPLQGAL